MTASSAKTAALALAAALMLAGCTAPEAGGSQPDTAASAGSSAPEETILPEESAPTEESAPEESEADPDRPLSPEVEALAYRFDVQVILDGLTARLEQYSRLDAQAENFPRRSVEIMEEMGRAFGEIAALPAPAGYEQVPKLAAEAADTMAAVAEQVAEAFRLGRTTPEGSAVLQQANAGFGTAVDRLEEMGAILAPPEPDTGDAQP